MSIRIILILLFIIQILISVGLTSIFSFQNSQIAVNDVALQLRNELTSHINDSLRSYLRIPFLVNKINVDSFKQKRINLKDFNGLEKYFYNQLQEFETVSYIAF
ncbi:MAG: adenylate/guanylate cyclase domain-containing protein, partial [Nitrospirota bacterium]